MVRSAARSVTEYLGELPDDRRRIVDQVRKMVLDNLPEGYVETMEYGMIVYQVPLDRYPTTYNGKPLAYVALAAQKNYTSLYLTGVYQSSDGREALRKAFDDAGKKFDVGESCVRFRKVEDLPLEAIGEMIGGMSVESFVENYERGRAGR